MDFRYTLEDLKHFLVHQTWWDIDGSFYGATHSYNFTVYLARSREGNVYAALMVAHNGTDVMIEDLGLVVPHEAPGDDGKLRFAMSFRLPDAEGRTRPRLFRCALLEKDGKTHVCLHVP